VISGDKLGETKEIFLFGSPLSLHEVEECINLKSAIYPLTVLSLLRVKEYAKTVFKRASKKNLTPETWILVPVSK
jgi:hypothetical protein